MKLPTTDMAKVPGTGYDFTGISNGKGLYLGLPVGTDKGYAAEDIAQHMAGVLRTTDPSLQYGIEPIINSDPSCGYSVIGFTPNECLLEIKVKPVKGGLEIMPRIGNGVATKFLKAYQHVLESDVAAKAV